MSEYKRQSEEFTEENLYLIYRVGVGFMKNEALGMEVEGG